MDSAMKGYQFGSAMRSDKEKKDAILAQQEKGQQMQSDLAALSQNKSATAKDYSDMMLKYPEMAKTLSEPMGLMSEEEKNTHRKSALNVYAALNSDQPDQAKAIMEKSLEAAENSGDQKSIDSAKIMLGLINSSPEAAKTSAGLYLSESMGADKFATTLDKLNPQASGIKKDKVSVSDWDKLAATSLGVKRGSLGAMTFGKTMGDVSLAIQERAAELYAEKPTLNPQAAINIATNELWIKSGMKKLKEGTFNGKELVSDEEFEETWRNVMNNKRSVKDLKKKQGITIKEPEKQVKKAEPEAEKDPAGLDKFFGL